MRRPKSELRITSEDGWLRYNSHSVISDHRFEYLISTAIVTNFALMVVETEWTARCEDECVPLWVPMCNAALLALYTIEAILRIYAYRGQHFKSKWDLFDLGIVIAGYMEYLPNIFGWSGVPGLAILRIVRLARLARTSKLIKMFPDLAAMVRGFLSAMSAMLWGVSAIFIMLLLFAVLAVELLDHQNNGLHSEGDACNDVFSSVPVAMLWFFQTMIAGDSFGTCSVPLIKASPSSALLLCTALITMQLGFTNMILAVIVEKAADAFQKDKADQADLMQQKKHEAFCELQEMCEAMDNNRDGKLSVDELVQAFDANEQFQDCMIVLGIDVDRLRSLYGYMDTDDSGYLTYKELIECLHSSDQDNLKQQMMMVKLRVEDVWSQVHDRLQVTIDYMVAQLQKKGHFDRWPDSDAHGFQQRIDRLLKNESGENKADASEQKNKAVNDIDASENLQAPLSNMHAVSTASVLIPSSFMEFQNLLSGTLLSLSEQLEKEFAALVLEDRKREDELKRLRASLSKSEIESKLEQL
eukprot:TRINITY_DN24240_c1_g1_i1.p1 TRINITY_DN24240_c1_g1~~TRINITY_DN24240_c1_g1_i1.p1  ORF type:complete len:527 (-),score=109.98 TRINITY_DN24240_c1_g1_i1:61-1641(-)